MDNTPSAYSLHPLNGIPIETWEGDKKDQEFIKITPILIYLSKVEDVRDYIEKFVIRNIICYEIFHKYIEELREKSQGIFKANSIKEEPKSTKNIKIRLTNSDFIPSNKVFDENTSNKEEKRSLESQKKELNNKNEKNIKLNESLSINLKKECAQNQMKQKEIKINDNSKPSIISLQYNLKNVINEKNKNNCNNQIKSRKVEDEKPSNIIEENKILGKTNLQLYTKCSQINSIKDIKIENNVDKSISDYEDVGSETSLSMIKK